MTEAQVRDLLVKMTAALPREWSFLTPEQQQATEAIYVRMLTDLPWSAACSGVESLLATAKAMPTIADVRAATLRAMHGDVRPAGDAWGEIRKLTSYRDHDNVEGVDALAVYVCERMGWIRRRILSRRGVEVAQWCVSLGENEASDRKQFIDLYEALAAKQRHEVNVSQLPAATRHRALQAAQQPQLGAQRVDAMRLLKQITDGESK